MKPRRLFCLTALICLMFSLTTGQTPPVSQIFLAELTTRGGQLNVGRVAAVTKSTGYNNQPSFLPDGGSILFVSDREGGQADIFRYDIARDKTTRVTETRESEYSPTLMPGGKSISVIRVEADEAKTQRLWQFPLSGGAPSLVLEKIKPVGYHVWADDNTLVLFVLGRPNTLQLVDRRTEKAEVVAENIGRSIHKVPGQMKVSFMHREGDGVFMIKELDVKTRRITPVVRPLATTEKDYAWTPDGTLLMANDSKLFKYHPGRDKDWVEVFDFAAARLKGISRLAVSPKGDRLALVAQPMKTN